MKPHIRLRYKRVTLPVPGQPSASFEAEVWRAEDHTHAVNIGGAWFSDPRKAIQRWQENRQLFNSIKRAAFGLPGNQ